MSSTRKMRTHQECQAQALHRRSFRRSLALILGIGLTSSFLELKSIAQYAAGDLPASPWSNRGEHLQGRRMDDAVQSSNTRLRQPTSPKSEAAIDLRPADAPAGRAARPAPVTLLGPALPTVRPQPQSLPSARTQDASRNSGMLIHAPIAAPSAIRSDSANPTLAQPHDAFAQQKPTQASSDWHRVQAGGLVLESESAPYDGLQLQAANAGSPGARSPLSHRIGAGLPDRIEETNLPPLSSQMVSLKSSTGREQPIHLKSPSPIIEKEVTEPDWNALVLSQAAPAKPSPASTLTRRESVLQSEAPIETATPDLSNYAVRLAGKPKASPKEKVATSSAEWANSQPTYRRPVSEDYQTQKLALAQRVSHELLANTVANSAPAPIALETLPGWQSVESELKQRLERCDTLLKRGGVLSAREEASQGLLRLFRTMDLYRGHLFSEPAFEKALVAFREESDFQKTIRSSRATGLQAIVDTHTTDALKNRPLESTSPEMASMHYRWYARFQLLTASDGHPWAADLLYAYGKTLEREADLDPTRTVMLRSQAVVCYQAATQIAPAQSDAANQLGYALIHLDRMEDAQTALMASIQNKPSPNAWNNLAEIFRRQGKPDDAEYAVQQATALESVSPVYSQQNPEITEVDPAVFAKYSPAPNMVSPPQDFPTNSLPAHGSYGNVAKAPVPKSSKSFFSKFFQK